MEATSAKLGRCQTKNEQLKAAASESARQSKSLRVRYSGAKKQLEKMRQQVSSKSKQLNTIERRFSSDEGSDLVTAQKKISLCKKEIMNLRKQKTGLESQLKESATCTEKYKSESARLWSSLHIKAAKLGIYRHNATGIIKFSKLEDELSQTKSDYDELGKSHKELKKQCSKLEREIQKLRAGSSEKEAIISDFRTEHVDLNQTVEQLRTDALSSEKQISILAKEKTGCLDYIKEMLDANNDLISRTTSLEDQLNRVTQQALRSNSHIDVLTALI
eukprot:969168_1